MGVGKYSPTVSNWYRRDQKWHEKHCAENEWYDRDGYDSYGYHRDTEQDRAGYTEWDYLGDGKWADEGLATEEYVYDLYDYVMGEWAGRPFPWEKNG
jgi:hypothetical protein